MPPKRKMGLSTPKNVQAVPKSQREITMFFNKKASTPGTQVPPLQGIESSSLSSSSGGMIKSPPTTPRNPTGQPKVLNALVLSGSSPSSSSSSSSEMLQSPRPSAYARPSSSSSSSSGINSPRMVKSPQPQAYVGSSFSGSFSSSSSSSSKIPDLKIMDLPLPMNDKSSGHASTIGFKLMQLDPSNPKSKYRDVLYSEKNDNSFKAGFTRRDDTIERYNTGGPIEFDALTEPRNHSEPNALTDIMKSLETSIRNHIPNNQTTLLNSLQRPYRAKIYIRNSKYPPCVTKYGNYVGTKIENQRGAPCDSYIEAQRRSLIGKYHGVDFRIKIGNQGSGPILGGYVEPGIRRYGYGEGKDGFNMKKDKDKNWLNYIG